MFQLKLKAVKESESYLIDSASDAITIWHKKFRHNSEDNLKTLVQISEEMNLTAEDLKKLEKVCDICQKAKQTRTKFGEARLKAKRPLEIIHNNMCGLINPPTWDGNRYFVTFLDDFTHYTMAFLIKSKEKVPRKFKEYVERIEARWDKRVYKLRCDSGKKFINDKVIRCEDKGIELDRTIPYTPDLNGRKD